MLKKALTPVAPLVLLAATAVALPAQDATLQEVLQGHYEAIGGLDAWQDVQSVKIEGRMALGPDMEAPFTAWNARPRQSRVDFTFQGMTGTQAFNGEQGWMIMPFTGSTEPEPMPEDQAAMMREDADLDGPLIGYEEDGIELELLGTEEVEGTPAYKIQVTLSDGDVRYYYLDTDYYLPIRVEGSRQMQGQTVDFYTILGDYKEVGGLLMAHSIESRAAGMPQGQSQVMTIDSVEINPEIPEGFFTMPESDSGS